MAAATATPALTQVEDADCGPVCLGIVLAHRGIDVPGAQLRTECRAGRDGSTAADLLRAAARHGLQGRGARVHAEDAVVLGTALGRFDLPAIALLRRGHFVVVESVTGAGAVAVNDPARGRSSMPAPAFAAEFGGIVLTFPPAEGPAVRHRAALSRDGAARLHACLMWLRPVRGHVVGAVTAGAVTGSVLAAAALLARVVPAAGGVLVALAGLVGALAWVQRRALSAVLDRTAARRAREVLDTLLGVKAPLLARRPMAALLAQVHLADVSAVLLAHRVVPLLAGVALLTPLLAVLGALSPATAAVAVAGVAAAALLRLVGDRRSAAPRRVVAGELSRRDGIARAALVRGAAMAAEGSDEDLFVELTDLHERDLRARDDAARSQAPWHAAATAVELAAVPAACTLLAVGSAGPAALVALCLFLGAARTVADLTRELPEFVRRLAVLDDLAELPVLPRHRTEAVGRGRALDGRVELADVTFGFTPGRAPLLHGLDLVVPAGTRLVLRGAPGAGRSTLLRLLAGSLDPTAGRVLLDGACPADLPREVLAGSVGVFFQNPWLFPGTVADNITLLDDSIDDDLIAAALADACLDDVVARRGGPHHAVVAPGGRNLAGGERQRLVLARALVRRPSVLLLDEPTSGADPLLASRIDAMLRRRAVTTVIATDAPDAARPGDLVGTLREGRLHVAEVAR